jgi:hypothetical protein
MIMPMLLLLGKHQHCPNDQIKTSLKIDAGPQQKDYHVL